jgi:hypothetical protein
MVSATPDNANPIIHTSAASRRPRKRADSLDLSDDDEWARLGRDSSDDGLYDDELQEEIDGDEIFGESRSAELSSGASRGWLVERGSAGSRGAFNEGVECDSRRCFRLYSEPRRARPVSAAPWRLGSLSREGRVAGVSMVAGS